MAKKTHYAIRRGRQSMMIVNSWDKCRALVEGFGGAEFMGFTCKEHAEMYLSSYAPAGAGGEFIPPTDIRDKFGYFKPRYYSENGCQLAYYGTTIGANYHPSTETGLPWE